MTGSVNKVILVGNVGRDPETRTMANGDKIANFTMATSESWNDKSSGERQERTEWHRVAVMNPRTAEIVEKFVRKGMSVYVEGQIQSRKWTDKDGNERTTTEVVIGRFKGELTMLGGGKPAEGPAEGGYQPAPSAGRRPSPAPSTKKQELDDEIPF